MAEIPDRISPLDGLFEPGDFGAVTNSPGVEYSQRLCGALVQVQAWPGTTGKVEAVLKQVLGLPVPKARLAHMKDETILMSTGPGRWLVDDEMEGLEEKLRKALPSDLGALTGLTHARVVISVSGEKAEWVLSSGIAMDFHVNAFPGGGVQLGHHHEIGVTIHRLGANHFELYAFTSLAHGLWHWLTHAGAEVGYRVT